MSGIDFELMVKRLLEDDADEEIARQMESEQNDEPPRNQPQMENTTGIHSHIPSSISSSDSLNEHNNQGYVMEEASGNEYSGRFDPSFAPPNPVIQSTAPMPYAPPIPVMLMPMPPPPIMMMPMRIRPPYMMPPPFQVGYVPYLPPGTPIAWPPPYMHRGVIPNPNLRFEDPVNQENTRFIPMNESPITILVRLPNATPTAEGQMIPICLTLSDSIATLKAKIQGETGIPSANQRIFNEGIVLEDIYTAAYYNLANGTIIHLAVNRRGGRQK